MTGYVVVKIILWSLKVINDHNTVVVRYYYRLRRYKL
jgi:hypothetical protein